MACDQRPPATCDHVPDARWIVPPALEERLQFGPKLATLMARIAWPAKVDRQRLPVPPAAQFDQPGSERRHHEHDQARAEHGAVHGASPCRRVLSQVGARRRARSTMPSSTPRVTARLLKKYMKKNSGSSSSRSPLPSSTPAAPTW